MSELETHEFRVPALLPDGPYCGDCVERLSEALDSTHGVESVEIDPARATVEVAYDPSILSAEHLEAAAERAGIDIAERISHEAYRVRGLDCPDCAATVDKSVSYLDGVLAAGLNFTTGVLLVEYDPATDPRGQVESAVRRMGYGIEPLAAEVRAAEPEQERAAWLPGNALERSVGVSGVFVALGWLLSAAGAEWADAASVVCFAVAIAAGGWITARRALASVSARALDMNVLMTIAVIGAVLLGEWAEGAMVVFLFALGNTLEARALARTRRSVRGLMELAPARARVRRGDEDVELDTGEVVPGDTMIVRGGERVALDGVIAHGECVVDESPVTGESLPQTRSPGERLYSGSLVVEGLVEAEVTSLVEDSTLARIIYLVEEAQAAKAPSERLVDRFTRYYTPAVIGLAAFVAFVPPVAGYLSGADWGGFEEWVYRGLVLLVVSCPCALVISTPVAVVSAITNASRMGVLVKGGAYLEAAPETKVVAFDKTGTLTTGRPEVAEVVPLAGEDESRVLEVAGALGAGSTHPIARAVARAAGTDGTVGHLESFRDEVGRGVEATIDGVAYGIGSPTAAHEAGVPFHTIAEGTERLESAGRTVVVLFSEERALGLIGVADAVRPESREAVEGLRSEGVRHVVMLTGDSERIAEAIAEEAGVEEIRAKLMPDEKVASVEELANRFGPVAMVGDGVNDAPALAASDVGIAMGVAGTDAALETADVALMRDDLRLLPRFFRLGRRTRANIVENIVFSVGVKLVVLVLALFGIASLWMAVFADTGVALIVIFNGLRLLRE
jgi:Cd2+/Zn2+-exporting ATPase